MMTARMRLLEGLVKLTAPRPAATSNPDTSARKLLVIKLSGLGDAVMVRSLINHFRKRDPMLKIGVLGGPSTIEALSSCSDFRVHRYQPDKSLLRHVWKLFWEIRHSDYDTLIDFEPYSMLTAAFGRATRIACRIGFAGLDGSPRARFFTCPVPIDDGIRFWDNFVALSRIIAPELHEKTATLSLPESELVKQWIENWLKERLSSNEANDLVALHLGAAPRMAYRCWPLERFVELANALKDRLPKLTIVLTGTRLETHLVGKFQARYSGNCVDATSLTTLEYTSALLRRCQLLISNDTGIMHLAAALGTRTLGLFGASNPAHWAPKGQHTRYLYSTKVKCSPCIDVYHRQAPTDCFNSDYQRCMNDITPALVCETAMTLLRNKGSNRSGLFAQ
jgi:heptosyltransferase-2